MSEDFLFQIYYMIGGRPIRISYIAENTPVMAEIPDPENKAFKIDNHFIHIAAKSMDAIEVDKDHFDKWCTENGYSAA